MREAASCSVKECQQLSQWQLTLNLALKISGGSRGIISYFVRGLPSKPLSPPTISVQNQLMYTNLPPPLDGQMQTAVSLLVYEASLVEVLWTEGVSTNAMKRAQ